MYSVGPRAATRSSSIELSSACRRCQDPSCPSSKSPTCWCSALSSAIVSTLKSGRRWLRLAHVVTDGQFAKELSTSLRRYSQRDGRRKKPRSLQLHAFADSIICNNRTVDERGVGRPSARLAAERSALQDLELRPRPCCCLIVQFGRACT